MLIAILLVTGVVLISIGIYVQQQLKKNIYHADAEIGANICMVLSFAIGILCILCLFLTIMNIPIW